MLIFFDYFNNFNSRAQPDSVQNVEKKGKLKYEENKNREFSICSLR